jgi:hypothetical protein
MKVAERVILQCTRDSEGNNWGTTGCIYHLSLYAENNGQSSHIVRILQVPDLNTCKTWLITMNLLIQITKKVMKSTWQWDRMYK